MLCHSSVLASLAKAKASGFPPFQLAFWHCSVGISLKEWTLLIRPLWQTVRGLVITVQLQKWCCMLERNSKALVSLETKFLAFEYLNEINKPALVQPKLVTSWRSRKQSVDWTCVCRVRVLVGITCFSHKNAIEYYRLFASLLIDDVTSHIFYNENLKRVIRSW